MFKIIRNLKNIFIYQEIKNNNSYQAASKLEKKANALNIKSEKYLKLAKQRARDWKEKWIKDINNFY
tara:strand:- start:2656 stop:2856 length:201 start_codon:yes stop_codon:yes gene_type:complete